MFTVSLTRKMHCLYRGDLTSVSNAFASSLKNVRDDFKSSSFSLSLVYSAAFLARSYINLNIKVANSTKACWKNASYIDHVSTHVHQKK